MTFFKYAASAVAALAILSSCKKEDPQIPNEEELITTVIYTLISHDNQDTAVFEFVDLDGDGGNAPSIKNDMLKANTLYHGTVQLLNEQENPAEDITDEVKAEAEEHQFFYTPDVILNATFTYTDMDADNNPIGVTTDVMTGNVSMGDFTLVLRHEPDKNAQGVKDGDITNAGGATDIEVTFNADVQ
jgi:hypothetical protein